MADADDRAAAESLIGALGGTHGAGHPDVVVADEWTPEHDPAITQARSTGARVTTLAELVIARHAGRWVGVTGTAGKTSTCRALAHILRSAGQPVVMSETARSGNAWPDWSLAGVDADPDAVLIAELTSSHLCHMHSPLAPDVAVITLLRPDHPDLHPSNNAYVAAKARLVPPVGHPGAVVLPTDDPATLAALPDACRGDFGFGAEPSDAPGVYLAAPARLAVIGERGQVQAGIHLESPTATRAALAAGATALALGIAPESVASGLADLPIAPHRQHMVGRFRDAWVVDDTMAATPRKVLAAVRHFRARNPVLVLGGDPCAHPPGDREAVVEEIRRAGIRVVTFGPMGDEIAAAVSAASRAPTVMGAVATAATMAGPDGLVLVSPMFAMQPAERERVAALPTP